MVFRISVYLFVFVSLYLKAAVSRKCDEYEFPCGDGDCIDKTQWCDTHEDCLNGLDEKYCQLGDHENKDPNKCPHTFFLCEDGSCIPIEGRCDGEYTCGDMSDERNCDLYAERRELPQYQTEPSRILQQKGSEKETMLNEHPHDGISGFRDPTSSHSSIDLDFGTFSVLHPEDFIHHKERARNWLVSQRREDFGWGPETPRALVALFTSKVHSADGSKSDMLMVKQMEVQLSVAISRNSTQVISLPDLALYINALVASCKDPRNFYGIDLVTVLRARVNAAHINEKFVSPTVSLALCSNNASTNEDARKLHGIVGSKNATFSRIDIQALALLSLSCISERTQFVTTEMYADLKSHFLQKVQSKNFPGNVYEAALIVQALNEAEVNENKWQRSNLMNFILDQQNEDGSFGSILATYLVLPILSGRNLLHLDDHCSSRFLSNDLTPIEVLKNTNRQRIFIQYALNYGDPVEMTQILQMKVANGTNFLDVMRLAQEINSKYRFELDDRHGIPTIHSIGGAPNDAEKGVFWSLHVASHKNRTSLIPYVGNIKDLIPNEADEFIYWLKSI